MSPPRVPTKNIHTIRDTERERQSLRERSEYARIYLRGARAHARSVLVVENPTPVPNGNSGTLELHSCVVCALVRVRAFYEDTVHTQRPSRP